MKKTLLAIALATTAFTSIAHAEYIYKLPLEIKGGGSLPNGTITFNNKATPVEPTTPSEPETPVEPTEPSEPTEPVVVDPFEPENPACDPNDQTYPGNVTGKELVWDDGFYNADGTPYRSCKLKDTGDLNILARYVAGIDADYTSSSGIVHSANQCNPSSALTTVSSGACRIAITYFSIPFTVEPNMGGDYNYAIKPIYFTMPSKATFSYDDIGRIEIDGHVCSNLRSYVLAKFPVVKYSTDRICDLNASYESLKDRVGQPFLITIYKK